MQKGKFFIILSIILILPLVTLSAHCKAGPEDETVMSDDEAGIDEETVEDDGSDSNGTEDEEDTSSDDKPVREEESGEADGEEGADAPDSEGDDTYAEREAPSIILEIYEGPVYAAAGDICYYRIKAIVSGDPDPTVSFSRDDSAGAFGPKKVQVNLSDPSDSYTLTATATNSEGSATESMLFAWGCETGEEKSSKGGPSPEGTTLEIIKDADGSSEGNVIWDIKKSVDKNHFDLTTGATATANYTVTLIPEYDENEVTVSGNISIKNTGIVDATINYVYDRVEYTIDNVNWTEITTGTIRGAPFTITAPGSIDIPYSISFSPPEGVKAYRNTIFVGLDNYAVSGGVVDFHEYSYITGFSISGGTAHNAFADVYDSLAGYLGESYVGDSSSYEFTYSWTIGPYDKTGNYVIENTATVKGRELSTEDNYSLNVSVSVTETVN